ncbi:hypothetical protein [Kitasatospora camelliae]|uniref:Uncharacterized protein n=1 Tax=Kitasatospora camelliae TaxID=3156397 RepID=A0AAU8JXA8_9ACTN
MLGDLIGEIQGHVTGRRVLGGEHGLAPTVETSVQVEGQLLGVAGRDWATYEARMRADGRLYGTGLGITMTQSGDSVTWRGQGVGTFTGPGRVSWRGSLVWEGGTGALAPLNEYAGVFEYEVDEDKVSGKVWAWK